MLYVVTPLRRKDGWGYGHFGAPRGTRKHNGVDFAAWPGSVLLSPLMGQVTKIGHPYADDLTYRYVQVTHDGENHRFFYVEPCVRVGQWVSMGDPLGAVQDLRERYSDERRGAIIPHVHYEIKLANGGYVEPELEE